LTFWFSALLLAITYVLNTPNGSCEPILDIYVSSVFQWYKELFNPMIFGPCKRLLKFWESIGSPIPKVGGVHLGVGFIPSHSPTFLGAWNVIFMLHSWPTPLKTFTLVLSPRLRLWQLEVSAFFLRSTTPWTPNLVERKKSMFDLQLSTPKDGC
jgi:hypothetical protein